MVSKYYSISEIFGVQWFNHLNTQNDSNKRRKLDAHIRVRQMNTFTRKIYQYVKTNTCAENESPSIYIETGAKYSSSRSTSNQQLIPKNLFYAEEESDLDILLGQPAVAESMTNFSKKNIKFPLIAIGLDISLFDAIAHARSDIEGENYLLDDTRTGEMTKRALINHAHYSELVVTSIVPWNVQRDLVKKKKGKKVCVEFEADIRGKLMICELEQKNVSRIEFL